MNALLSHRAAKPLLFVLALRPFARLLYGALTDGLGANPAEALMRGTGDWVLRFLCLTLAVTPLRQMDRLDALARLRRMLGPVHLLLRAAALPLLRLARHGLRLPRTSCATSRSGRSCWSARWRCC